MRYFIIISTLAIFYHPASEAKDIGRYAVSASDDRTVLVDTKTGKSWILLPSKYQQGPATSIQYEWSRIGFAKQKNTPRKKLIIPQ